MEDEIPSQVIMKRKAHEGGCSVLDYSSEYGQLVTGGCDGYVRVWDPRN